MDFDGMRLNIDIDGDVQLNRQIARWTGRGVDARPAWNRMADMLAAGEKKQFSSQGQYGSGGWKPLAPRYAAWKMRHYPGKPILERSGRLKQSLTERPFGIERLSSTEMVIGTAVPYSGYHQRGTGKMPRRRPFEIPRSERVQLAKVMQRFLARGEV